MLRIQLIRSAREDSNNKSGIGYYADYVESELTKLNHDVDTVILDPDLRHGFRNIPNMMNSVMQVIRRRGKYDAVHACAEHCALLLPFAKSKKIVTFHHVMRNGEADTGIWYLFWRLSIFISKIFTDEYIAISPQTKNDMIVKLKIPAEKITVAMHPPKSEMYREPAFKENLILYVGMLMERKNSKGSVSVFKKIIERPEFKEYKLVICGDGPQKEELSKLISDMNLEGNVELISNISVDELRGYYNRAKLFLNTSNYEGLGITTLEAQLCGTPVLYFEDADIPPEVMVAAVPCKNETDMADNAFRLLIDEYYRNKVIENGIKHSTEFGKNYVEKLLEVYGKELGSAPKAPN